MIKKSNSVITVNLEQLRTNVEAVTDHLDEKTQVMAVLKADAYGHGAVKVAEALDHQVAGFAVNNIREGIELRQGGLTKPILVFEVPRLSFAEQYAEFNLTATVSAEEHFEILPKGTAYHLNFDTGMGRLGFYPEEVNGVLELMEEHQSLSCTGLYSHFATSGNPGSEDVARQHRLFSEIRSYFADDFTAHICNTGGTAFYETEKYDMVRLGIGLYGYPPADTAIKGIAPALEWRSKLVQVRPIKTGSSVSYGATWQAPTDGFLGTIPVGYEDGLKRNLSGDMSVQMGGNEFPLVGRITMNYSMVFLGGERYDPRTEVKLLHKGNDAGTWAQKIGTIPYEILTSISPKIPRTYS